MKLYCLELCLLALILTVSGCRNKSETDGHRINALRQILITGSALGQVSATNLQAGKRPFSFTDYTNELSHIMKTQGLIIKQTRDNSGGWWYDEQTGKVFFNKNENIYLNDQSWVQIGEVDFSQSIDIQLRGERNIFLSDRLREMVSETENVRGIVKQK
ncbi:MAG: hypothetical protein SFY92_07995 [Verrucomicrobiae bacterium]|nr:hypothetical protein [Verrucomicrobiae bacterium]